MPELLKVHQAQQFVDPVAHLRLGAVTHFETESDVLRHAHVRERRVVLEHEADAALLRRQVRRVLALDTDVPLVGGFESGDDAQQRGLAASGRPQERGELARGERG
ncbi:hypothetical protein GCM10025876_31020 [Demequina litorisediminis]|uniref:Uncharacterized protein n=1 Tax=Demequina litorisediminis TaxID=1849022 RepID=A0ABQ6IIC5_9MICO|nr:hypothetical protein GCM10025876_31020 [Demequina litorisediminis]